MKVHLLKPHTHAGLLLPPGAELDLPGDSARWLIEMGSARAVPSLAHPPSESTAGTDDEGRNQEPRGRSLPSGSPSSESGESDETSRTGRGGARGGERPSPSSEESAIELAHARTTAKE